MALPVKAQLGRAEDQNGYRRVELCIVPFIWLWDLFNQLLIQDTRPSFQL